MCKVTYPCVCCFCAWTLSALDCLAEDCETSAGASVEPRGFVERASVALLWVPLQTQTEKKPIWNVFWWPVPQAWEQWGVQRWTAWVADQQGLSGPVWHWSAVAAECCLPSDRLYPGRAAASEHALGGSAAYRVAPPFPQSFLSLTSMKDRFMDQKQKLKLDTESGSVCQTCRSCFFILHSQQTNISSQKVVVEEQRRKQCPDCGHWLQNNPRGKAKKQK